MKKTYQHSVAEVIKASPSRLGQLAEKVTQLQAINQQLQQILSPELRPYCRVVNLRQRTLVIAVDTASRLTYLRFSRTKLFQQLQQQFPTLYLADLHFIVSPPITSTTHPTTFNATPLSPFSVELIRATAADIDDEELRQALLKLTRHIRKK